MVVCDFCECLKLTLKTLNWNGYEINTFYRSFSMTLGSHPHVPQHGSVQSVAMTTWYSGASNTPLRHKKMSTYWTTQSRLVFFNPTVWVLVPGNRPFNRIKLCGARVRSEGSTLFSGTSGFHGLDRVRAVVYHRLRDSKLEAVIDHLLGTTWSHHQCVNPN